MSDIAEKDIISAANLPLVLKVKPHVMTIMGICKEKAYELANREDFPAIRIGRTIRIPRDAFLRWMDKQAMTGERNGQ